MKITIKEAIKKISLLESQLKVLNDTEDKECYLIYLKDETPEKSNYSYEKFEKLREKLNGEILNLKIAIQKANIVTKTEYKNLTIAELLVLLAQKTLNVRRQESFANRKQKIRKTTNDGQIEYFEYLYDIEKVKKQSMLTQEEIVSIQVAIDKANLETYIEIK